MRISVVNFCSTAGQMLEFSSEMLIANAGTIDFDYLVVTWDPNKEVADYIAKHNRIKRIEYKANDRYDYVPNLRLMFNRGFEAGFELNPYVAIVNTDMAFGTNWLFNLARRAGPGIIPNSLHITPIKGPHVITADFGLPTAEVFNLVGFWELHNKLYQNKVETAQERGGWRNCATFPYVIHEKWWRTCGPWEPEVGQSPHPPDQRFFERCYQAGAEFILCHDSICYHQEAVERRSGQRPLGAEKMPEGR